MANKIFDEILVEEIEIFRNAFTNVSQKIFQNNTDNKLIHPGEFGMYREAIVKKFLRFFIPQNLEIDQGFLINSFDEVSNQCDIVVYDKNYTPFIKSNELQRFYPVETVCAIGEVKSTVDFQTLKSAVTKLYNAKKMAEKVCTNSTIRRYHNHEYNTDKKYGNDLITTFIVCQKLDFNLDKIGSLYDNDMNPSYMHNLILSLEDGVFLYSSEKDGETFMHHTPSFDGITQSQLARYSLETGGIDCFKIFCNLIFNSMIFKTIALPEILSYMKYPSN